MFNANLKNVIGLFSAFALGASLPLYGISANSTQADSAQPIVGSGKVITKEFTVADFSSVEASHTFLLDIVKGDAYSTKITVDDNLMPEVTVLKEGPVLRIGLTGKNKSYQNALWKVAIIMPNLDGIKLSGAGQATLKKFDSAKVFTASIDGVGKLAGEIKADKVNLTVSGAGTVKLTGSAKAGTINTSGASNLDLKDFLFGNAEVRLSGASRALLNVQDNLNCDANGASQITYRGNPTIGNKKQSGAAQVHMEK